MTNEERDIISQFIARVGGVQAGSAFGGSVPTTTPALPPVDREADALIADLFNRYPEARYRMTQLAFVQEHALSEAQNRIQRLEYELQQAQQVQQRQGSGGFFSGLFGGGRPQPPQGGPSPVWNQGQANPQYQQAAPPPQYPPGYQPGMFQRQGSGFLGSALSTAAGVTGGMLAANALMGLFSGPHGGGFAGGGYPGYGAPGAGPWGAPADQGYVDQGNWSQDVGGQPDPGYVDNGTWDTPGGDAGAAPDTSDSWDSSSGTDPGFDAGGGGNDDTF